MVIAAWTVEEITKMSFEDDIRRIYQREKDEYIKRVMDNQETLHPEYEFEDFEEWKKERGYNCR